MVNFCKNKVTLTAIALMYHLLSSQTLKKSNWFNFLEILKHHLIDYTKFQKYVDFDQTLFSSLILLNY